MYLVKLCDIAIDVWWKSRIFASMCSLNWVTDLDQKVLHCAYGQTLLCSVDVLNKFSYSVILCISNNVAC